MTINQHVNLRCSQCNKLTAHRRLTNAEFVKLSTKRQTWHYKLFSLIAELALPSYQERRVTETKYYRCTLCNTDYSPQNN